MSEKRGEYLVMPKDLTPREMEILGLLALGGKQVCIASRLNISRVTVRKHQTKILCKLGAATIAQAIHIAWQRGILFEGMARPDENDREK